MSLQSNSHQINSNIRFMPKSEVLEDISLSKSQLQRLINEGEFPAPVSIGARRVAFVESEVRQWQKARMEERNAGGSSRPAKSFQTDQDANTSKAFVESLVDYVVECRAEQETGL
jgi:prophage regulatory protein